MLVPLLLVVLAGPASTAESPSAGRVAVVVLGPDAALAGELQTAIERALDGVAGLTLAPGAEVGARLGARVVSPVGGSASPERARITSALERVRVAYYEDRAADAGAALAEAEGIDAASALALAVSSRIDVRLWRAALALLAGTDGETARTHARAALVLDPRLQVDVQRFPSDLKDLVDAVRKQALPAASVRVEGLPRDARLAIDDRPLTGATFSVMPGLHVFSVSAPGRRAHRVLQDVRAGEQMLTIRLPTGADETQTAALGALVSAPSGKEGEADALLVAAGVSGMVVVRDGRAAVVWRGASVKLVEVAERSTLPAAIRARIENDLVRERDLAVSRRAPRGSKEWVIEAGTRLSFASRLRRVRSGEGTYASGVAGAGPALALSARSVRVLMEGEASLVSFQANRYEVTTPQGGTDTARAGTLTALRIAGGGRFPVGSRETIVEIALGATHEIAREDSLEGAEGFNPSSTRTALELRAGARAPFGARGRMDGGLWVSPWSRWVESPTGATGRSPRPLPSLGAWAGTEWKLGTRWRAGLAWRGEVRAVQFSGNAAVPVDPPISGARLDETIQTVNASASMEF